MNPLFGEQHITTPAFNVTYYPTKSEDYECAKLLNLDYMTSNIKSYENLALDKAMLQNAKKAFSEGKIENVNPIIILKNMLDNAIQSGISFSEERIRDFEYVAKNLYRKILEQGLSNIKE